MDSRNMSSSYVPSVFAGNDDTIAELKPQPYQIVVNIIEARKLVWGSSQSHNSFVLVGIGKKKHKTSVKRNSIDPFYKEFFIFEIVGTSLDIQRTNLWVAVLEPRCYSPPKIIGEANVGLGYIWSQPNHQLIRKWIQLADSRNPASAGIVGYLKVDISISRKTENQPNQLVLPSVVSNDVGDNIFYNMMSEQQTANYVITIYGAYGLPSGTAYGKEKKISKLPSTFVRVCFCGLMVKTSTEHRNNNPEYKERINIVEMFPNVNDVIRFEICSVEGFNRVLATATLSFADISYDGENGFLPTFGPSLLHMYCTSNYNTTVSGEDNFYYRGSLLVSLNIQVPFFCSEMRSIKIEPVPPFLMGSAWNWEDFVANCLLLEVSMIDQSIFEKTCGVAMTIGEMNVSKKTDPEFSAMMEDSKAKKLYYTGNMALMNSRLPFGYLEFFNSFPVLQIATQLPDFRFRMYRNNMIGAMVSHLENTVTMVEKRLRTYDYTSLSALLGLLNKALDEVAVRIVKFVDVIQYCVENNEEQKQNLSTELDQKQMALQLDVLGKIYGSIIAKDCHANNIFGKRKRLKVRLSEVKLLIEKLNSLVGRSTEGWPDIIIWLLYNGSRAAYCKIPASDIIYSATADQNGQFCGKLRTIYMKPLRCLRHMNSTASACDCLAGKIEVLLWMGHFRQMNTFNEFIPPGHDLRSKDETLIVTSIQMMVECRVFLFQVTLNDVKENEHSQIFVRIHINNTVKDTEPRPKSRSTIWNEMIKFEKLMFTSMERLEIHPPTALCEVYEKEDGASTESDNINLIGRFSMNSTVNTVDDKCPKLQTHDLYRGQELTGAIRLSIEILQNQEKVLSTTEYRNDDGEMDVNCVSDMKERIHVPLVPNFHTYKVDVYWWGLREVNNTKKPSVSLEIDDLTIQSEILSDKKRDCNFTSCAMSRVFEVASNENYFPPIVIKLFDSSTFGRTIFSGKKVVQNPKKYFVHWYLKDERESSLKSTPLLSSPLSEVSQRSQIFEDTHRIRSYSALNMQVKTPLWKSIFRRKEVDSERMTLLPIVSKENNIIKRLNSKSEDWWFRYYTALTVDVEDDSENEHSLPYNRLTIYNSELELLPGFDKFKDWCSTLKLYNGDKTGIPERDEQQKRGYVKTGIAIYKWPPPEDSVAVSASGVDLSNGYFSDHPGNESKKFLVRAYIVNGVNLAREFDGKSNPYIVIRCGKKEFGDRNTFVPMASNPIFGRMFEFRCTLPEDYLLKISLYDHNILPPDELIGSTTIDLEDRIYTKHRAMVGLPSDYDVNNWRDCNRPSVILEELCMKNHIPPPISAKSSTLLVNGVEYTDDARERKSYMTYQEQKERICLSILNKWHTIPICGHHLVPEHIETRTLIHDEKPGLEQGKIQMWIDIFPLDTFVHVPPPVDITPKNLGEYELRVIVWDVKNISLMNHEDKKKKKVFVKAWLGIPEHCQHSDVQKFKTDEVMTFNWRMIFDLQYHHAERKIIIEDKSPYTDVEEHAQPNLIVQVLNFDPENTCDILGTCTLNLITMCRGSKRFEDCKTETLRTLPKLNIFTTASVRAWWPLNKTDPNTCETFQTGAINMEVCILPKEKAVLTPVGYGRAGPWPLPSPGKFKTAFNVFFLCDNHSIEIKDVLADKSKKIKFAAFLGVVLVVGVISYYFNVFNYFFKRQIVDTRSYVKRYEMQRKYPLNMDW